MFDLVINFKQLGWNWIVHPASYNAKYCTGGCNHAHTQDTKRGKLIAQAADFLTDDQTKSCCAPKELLPINLVYSNRFGNVYVQQFEDMVVSGCRCA